RDRNVTGVQTCALPIYVLAMGEFNRQLSAEEIGGYLPSEHLDRPTTGVTKSDAGEASLAAMDRKEEAALSNDQRLWVNEEHQPRSEERRVGKEGRRRAG